MFNTEKFMSRKWIIESLLDLDFYKISMGQMIFHLHPNVLVRFAFKCRTRGVNLLEHISIEELRAQMEHVQSLHISYTDYSFLLGQDQYGDRMLKRDYLRFMQTLSLPDFIIRTENGKLEIEFFGPWASVTYWETICLSIVNELYYRSLLEKLSRFERDQRFATGQLRLAEKIRKLKDHAERCRAEGRGYGVVFSEFGTRRRFSREWQDYVVSVLAEEFPKPSPLEDNPQFRGTSNTLLAQKRGLLPMGSRAHELDMVYSGIYHEEDERDQLYSLKRSLSDWEQEYNLDLSVALPDTYGSDFFFNKIFSEQQFREWKGSRQDSGNPFDYGEKRILEYSQRGIDPRTKLVLFSDGLDVDLIIRIYDHFWGRLGCTFGWGTNLTNDLGFAPLSLVAKVVEADGRKVVKLSDNILKATGDPKAIERMKRLTGYHETFAEKPTY